MRWRKLERHEITALAVGLLASLTLFAFISFAGEVMEGDTHAIDQQILVALRNPADLSDPLGPPWLESVFLDLTAIGGPVVLSLFVMSIAGFLALQERYRTALVIIVTAVSGELANSLLKALFVRPRPDVVPHLREVASASFPSGHAMESAIIYLTLGAMLMRIAERRLTKIYCMSMAIMLTLLVGISRVYLGVHYPSDVLGGWMFGFAWASACWLIERWLEPVSGVAEERSEA